MCIRDSVISAETVSGATPAKKVRFALEVRFKDGARWSDRACSEGKCIKKRLASECKAEALARSKWRDCDKMRTGLKAKARGLPSSTVPHIALAALRAKELNEAIERVGTFGVSKPEHFWFHLRRAFLIDSEIPVTIGRWLWCGLSGLRPRVVGGVRCRLARSSPGCGVNRRRRRDLLVSGRIGCGMLSRRRR